MELAQREINRHQTPVGLDLEKKTAGLPVGRLSWTICSKTLKVYKNLQGLDFDTFRDGAIIVDQKGLIVPISS
jgi:hypothetical protein